MALCSHIHIASLQRTWSSDLCFCGVFRVSPGLWFPGFVLGPFGFFGTPPNCKNVCIDVLSPFKLPRIFLAEDLLSFSMTQLTSSNHIWSCVFLYFLWSLVLSDFIQTDAGSNNKCNSVSFCWSFSPTFF